MNVFCKACGRDDIPETEGLEVAPGVIIGGDTTANDHLKLWHPNEWFSMERVDGVLVLTPEPNHIPGGANA